MKTIKELKEQFVASGMAEKMAQETAQRNALLLERMTKEPKVGFVFRKADGTERTAHGTLIEGVCAEIKGVERNKSEKVQPYWDVDKKAWRSFTKSSLIEVL